MGAIRAAYRIAPHVWQYHPMDDEGVTLSYPARRFSRRIHVRGERVVTLPLRQIDNAQVCAARMPI
ncbi:hypothetical protein [Nitrosospira sp. NpAV]|uniref:hypothetical protein n=1 Tax=Nitrosospira sp. NpAV TaxID=58133 RepID=UPI0005A2BC0F|nr:hypothetical protein [Nitrosospira sp. NpAV]KIO48854.1 hypothetical protein SQ11_08660 [Nitrosospira sp. NpAV]